MSTPGSVHTDVAGSTAARWVRFAILLLCLRLHPLWGGVELDIDHGGCGGGAVRPGRLQIPERVERAVQTTFQCDFVAREFGERMAVGSGVHERRCERFLIAGGLGLGGAGERGRVERSIGDGCGEHLPSLFGEQQRRRALVRGSRPAGVARALVQRLILKHAGLDAGDALEAPFVTGNALDELVFDRSHGREVLMSASR